MTRESQLRIRYGITEADYAERVKKQNGRCAICNKTCSPLHVDHDHVTGIVRGLLCSNCNTGIGLFQESIRCLAQAIVYLEDHGKKF